MGVGCMCSKARTRHVATSLPLIWTVWMQWPSLWLSRGCRVLSNYPPHSLPLDLCSSLRGVFAPGKLSISHAVSLQCGVVFGVGFHQVRRVCRVSSGECVRECRSFAFQTMNNFLLFDITWASKVKQKVYNVGFKLRVSVETTGLVMALIYLLSISKNTN